MEQWITNNQFKVTFGQQCYGFSKISNLSAELEYDSIMEGGRNESPLLFRKARSKQDVMTLERGVRTVRTNMKEPRLLPGTLLKAVVFFIRMDQKTYRKYTFDEGVITKIQLTDLNALGNEVLIEKMEIAHSGLYEISV